MTNRLQRARKLTNAQWIQIQSTGINGYDEHDQHLGHVTCMKLNEYVREIYENMSPRETIMLAQLAGWYAETPWLDKKWIPLKLVTFDGERWKITDLGRAVLRVGETS